MLKSTFFAALVLAAQCANTQNLEYPQLYKSLNLPEYDDATITELGRQNESLKDGLKIYLESPSDYTTLRTYYELEMAALAWELEESIAIQKMREKGKLGLIPFGGVFHKEDMTYQIFTTRLGNVTKINITVLED